MRTSVAGESSERRYLSLEDVITLSLPSLSLPPTGVSQSHGSANSVTTALTDYTGYTVGMFILELVLLGPTSLYCCLSCKFRQHDSTLVFIYFF